MEFAMFRNTTPSGSVEIPDFGEVTDASSLRVECVGEIKKKILPKENLTRIYIKANLHTCLSRGKY